MIDRIVELAGSRLVLAALAAAFGAMITLFLLPPSAHAPGSGRPAMPNAASQAGTPPSPTEASAPPRPAEAPQPAAPPATSQATSAQASRLPTPPAWRGQPLPFEQAVLKAAETLFDQAQIDPARLASATRIPLVIDPLVDGVAGTESVATRTIGARLAAFVASRHPKFEVRRFSHASLKTEPLVLLGTFTGVNAEGKPTGAREAYRVWLTLIDLSTRKVVGKATTHAQVEGVDATPTAAFRDAPAWTADPATAAYLDACQKSRLGEPAPTGYLERIRTAASIAQAIEEYEASQYRQSLATFVRVLLAPEGNQLRVHTGVYLNHWKLKDGEQTRAAFARVVDFGLEHGVLAVKFEFRPGSAALRDASKGVAAQYPMWLNTIATRAARSGQCLDLTGHSSPTGPEPLNQRLSVRRAEFVATRLASEAPALRQRMVAGGAGSSATMIGNGRDDDSDALDRRVELRLLDCSFRTGG